MDARLVSDGSFESRARAQAAIRAGLVSVDGAVAVKPSMIVPPGVKIDISGDVHDYVSRGGKKLVAALRAFDIAPTGKTCLDLGASTGGFTDVLLRTGAARVYAVDVGCGQLHARLREDARVISLENTHARDLSPQLIPLAIDFLVCDVSFISLKKALPPALALCRTGALLVALVKPQFEVGRENIGKRGIVPEAAATAAARDLEAWMRLQSGGSVYGCIDSPIRGGDGNREYLLGAVKDI